MTISRLLLFAGSVSLAVLRAQPASYTVTQANSLFGPVVEMTVYRDGSKAAIDHLESGVAKTRTVYDLQTHTSYTWTLATPADGCSVGGYSGDWGDPFAMTAEIAQEHPTQTGKETMNGVVTDVLEATGGGAKIKIWLDPKSNLVMKAEMIQPGTPARTITEIKKFTPGSPSATVFALPASCSGPRPPTPSEHLATITGGNPSDFASANVGPASPNSCTVFIRVVHAGSMQPVNGFQFAIDTTYNVNNPPHYVTGISEAGKANFSGGGIHEVTNQLRNGVFRLDNAPATFYVETQFGKAGGASAGIYRHCFAPQSVLLFVVNPEKLGEGGDWLWVKSGKYASPEAR